MYIEYRAAEMMNKECSGKLTGSKRETFWGGGEEPLMSEPMADPDHPVSQL